MFFKQGIVKMKKIALGATLVCLLCTSLLAFADEWYEGGTLENANGNEWREASEENKVTSAGGLLKEMYEQGYLDPRVFPDVNSVDDLRPHAESLAMYTDEVIDHVVEGAESPAQAEKLLSYMLGPLTYGAARMGEAASEE